MNDFPKGNKNDALWWVISVAALLTGGLWFVGVALMVLNAKGKLPPVGELIEWLRRRASQKRLDSDFTARASSEARARWNGETQQTAQTPPRPSAQAQTTTQGTYRTPEQEKKKDSLFRKPKNPVGSGLAPTIVAIVLACLSSLILFAAGAELVTADWREALEALWVSIPFLLATAVLFGIGAHKRKKKQRFDVLQQLIDAGRVFSASKLSSLSGSPEETVLKDLQDMIDRGYLPEGAWIDRSAGKLMLTPYEEPEKHAEPAEAETEAQRVLRQIRRDNDLIDDPEISDKIDRIESLTAKIFAFQEQHPERVGELRSFTNYYLPQTLKLLESYARLEAQDLDVQNITETKQKISDMLDKLLKGYERQLNKLFSSEAIDITADIQVMEQMLAKDGLAEDVFKP